MIKRTIVKILRAIENISFILLLIGWVFSAIAELTNPPTTEKIFNAIGISNYEVFIPVFVVSTIFVSCITPFIIKILEDD